MAKLIFKILSLCCFLATILTQSTFGVKPCSKMRCQSNGQCVDNLSLCPVSMSCPETFFKTNQFTCSKDNKNIITSSCPRDKVTCWDNTCRNDYVECPSMTTCPRDYGVRCPDNSCVKSVNDCPKYVPCPEFTPIRCSNGDCRKRPEDCPSQLRCPKEFSVLCNDGSCRMTSDQCKMPAIQTQCSDQTMTRCPDGTCTSSKFLCSTLKTCPQGFIQCWDGDCAKNYETCIKPESGQSNSCSNEDMVRCAVDGSCRPDISFCPTNIICPPDQPVRCWDHSCKASIEKCPEYQQCPKETKKCNDGSCTTEDCGTHITCSMDAPFKCFDNTCRRNPEDCPEPTECPSKTPILCWNGKCVSSRAECLPPQLCPNTEPVKCPDNMCRKTIEECKEINGCPTGFIRCMDGSCKRKSADCQKHKCPFNFPIKCKNGLCVSSKKYCEKDNGCPHHLPHKCRDGLCVNNFGDCKKENQKNICGKANEKKLCADGSCLPLAMPCPAENGCPIDSSFRCANGLCINPQKNECPIPICPAATPIKCPDGLCTVSISSCHSQYKFLNTKECNEMNACADGTCANNPEECKPVFNCPVGFERCQDGTCRSSKEYCPKANNCPKNRSFRCVDGSCAVDQGSCLNISGCPEKTPYKCPNSGLCVEQQYTCSRYEDQFSKANGCPKYAPLKCPKGKCVTNLNNCEEKICSNNEVYCRNAGVCRKSLRDCFKLGTNCPEGFIRCPGDEKCKEKYEECKNHQECPVESPFRCINGTCKKFPSPFRTNIGKEADSCSIGLQCPDYKPYLCADGSCEQKSSFCRTFMPCPKDKPYRCSNRMCAANKAQCDVTVKSCPSSNPLLCMENGNCVSNIFDCQDDTCPDDKPFKCVNGVCEDTPRKCVINKLTKSTVCAADEVTCYDGSCRTNLEFCPIYPGCTKPSHPLKCPDGSCRKTKEDCPLLETKVKEGHKLCEDGIERKVCPNYNGCSNAAPMNCPNGKCVNAMYECAGLSRCPIDKPFKCFDGSCVVSSKECQRTKKNFVGTDTALFVYSFTQVYADIIIGENNEVLGTIEVPSNTFKNVEKKGEKSNDEDKKEDDESSKDETKQLKSSSETMMILRSYPSSGIKNFKAPYNMTRQDDVLRVFPFGDEDNDYHLEYEYSVLSPVLEIDIDISKVEIENYILLTLAYDFPDKADQESSKNSLDIKLDPLKDICLGRLENKKWQCSGTVSSAVSSVNYLLQGGIRAPGIYAVIMSPQENTKKVDIVPNFLVKYFLIILISFLVVGLVVSLGIYVFWRIYRYRGKYKESREESKKFESKMNEMQMIGTSHLGQTLGDNLDNIIYTNNPSFKVKKQEGSNQRTEELENLRESMNKRYKTLERNNDQLKKRYEDMKGELDRLEEYKKNLEKSDRQESDSKLEIPDHTAEKHEAEI